MVDLRRRSGRCREKLGRSGSGQGRAGQAKARRGGLATCRESHRVVVAPRSLARSCGACSGQPSSHSP